MEYLPSISRCDTERQVWRHRQRPGPSLLLAATLTLATCATSPLTASGSGWGSLVDDLIPSVSVTLTHPPSLGLAIDKVAFAESPGRCLGAFVDQLIGRFIENDIEVIERERLDQLLAERDLSISGYVTQEDAIAIGEFLGPSALIFVEENRCATDKSQTQRKFRDRDGNTHRIYYSKTEVNFSASLRIVALETGRIFTAKTFDATRSEVAEGRNSRPPYPPEHGPQSSAIESAAEQARRMFFPWTEVKELRYFKDKKCALALAYRMLQIGDVEGAIAQSELNLEQCKNDPKTKPKTLARAHYNLGMARFLIDDHKGALEHLETAHRIKPGPRIREAVLECKRAEKEWQEMRQYESRVALQDVAPARRPSLDDLPPTAPPGDTAHGDLGAPGSEMRTVEQRLTDLEALFEKGLIDEALYRAKRLEILEDL